MTALVSVKPWPGNKTVKGGSSCDCVGHSHSEGCVFNPMWSGEREKPSYSGGSKHNAHIGAPPPHRTSRHANIEAERRPLLARVLDVTRNFGPAKGIIDFTVQNLAQSYTPLPKMDLKQLDWNEAEAVEFESNLLCWHKTHLEEMSLCDSCESSGFTKMMRTFVFQLERYGEVFAMADYLNPDNAEHSHRKFGTAIMFVNPLRVRTPQNKRYNRDGTKRLVQEGIELSQKGKPRKYYVFDDAREDFAFWENSSNKKPKEVPAQLTGKLSHRPQMMHFFEKTEDDQIRGVSPFAASVEMLELLRQLLKDIALRASKQTKNLGFFQTDCDEAHDPNGPRILGQGENDQYKEWNDDEYLNQFRGCSPGHKHMIKRDYFHENQRTRERMDEAGVSYIVGYQDEKLTYSQVDNGRLAATELIDSTYDAIAACHGYSTNQIKRNYTDGNYTGQRSGRIDTERTLERKQCMTDEFATSFWKLAGEEAIDIGLLLFPQSVTDRHGLNNPETRREYVASNIDALFKHPWATPRSMIIEMSKDADGYEAMREQDLALWDQQLGEATNLTPEEFLSRKVKLEKQRAEADHEVAKFRQELFKDIAPVNETTAQQ